MTTLATDTYTRHEITTDQLRPGDIVLDRNTGNRAYAAFDVSAPAGPGDGGVRVWTATSDQTRGVPEIVDLLPYIGILVARRDADPRTIRTAA